MKKDIALPLLALAGGAAGFLLRRLQWGTGFEPDTGLPVSGNPPALILAALSLVMAALFLLLCRGEHRSFQGYDDAFLTHDPGTRAISNAAVPCLIVAGAWRMQELLLTDWPEASLAAATAQMLGGSGIPALLGGILLPVLCVLFCLGSAIAVLLITRNNYWGEKKGNRFVPLLIPAFGSCLWLILTYRDRSNDPVLAAYAYQILSIICVALALYQMATFSFSREHHPSATLFFSLMAVYFSLVALADGCRLTVSLLFLSCVLFFLSQSYVLLHNDARLPWPLPPVRPNRDEDDGGDED